MSGTPADLIQRMHEGSVDASFEVQTRLEAYERLRLHHAVVESEVVRLLAENEALRKAKP